MDELSASRRLYDYEMKLSGKADQSQTFVAANAMSPSGHTSWVLLDSWHTLNT